jgi:hypothetical protein
VFSRSRCVARYQRITCRQMPTRSFCNCLLSQYHREDEYSGLTSQLNMSQHGRGLVSQLQQRTCGVLEIQPTTWSVPILLDVHGEVGWQDGVSRTQAIPPHSDTRLMSREECTKNTLEVEGESADHLPRGFHRGSRLAPAKHVRLPGCSGLCEQSSTSSSRES